MMLLTMALIWAPAIGPSPRPAAGPLPRGEGTAFIRGDAAPGGASLFETKVPYCPLPTGEVARRAGEGLSVDPLSFLKSIPKPIRTIRLSEIRDAQKATTVTVAVDGTPVALNISFSKNYLQLLTVKLPTGETGTFSWDGLSHGETIGAFKLITAGPNLNLCRATVCSSTNFQVLADAAYAKALPLSVPHVDYRLLLSPDGRWLSMLRKNDIYYVGVYDLQALRTQPDYFVAVDNVLYGWTYQEGLLTAISKPIE